jgi:hypothetical protein
MFIDLWNKGENYAYSIVLNDTNKAIGSIDIHNIDLNNYSAEIGYWLAKDYNGNGYMSEAVKFIEKQAVTKEANEFYDDNYILESTNEGDFVFEITPYGESFGITEEMIKSTFIMI